MRMLPGTVLAYCSPMRASVRLLGLLAVFALALGSLAACGNDDTEPPTCLVGEPGPVCQGDNCTGAAWSSDLGSYGDVCKDGKECLSGLCAMDTATEKSYCTDVCDPAVATSCPDQVACFNAGPMFVCGPPALDCD